MKSVSVIIPTYNDEKILDVKIVTLLNKLNRTKLKYEIILINDGSKDKTLKIIEKFKKKNKNILLLNNKINVGKSCSIRKGLKKAKYEHIILIDSDLPYFNVFNKVVKKLKENFDFVFINRRHKKSSIKNKNLNLYQISRYLIGYFVSLIIRFLLTLNIYGGDTQSGLKGFKKVKNFNKLNFISNKFFLDLEIMYYYKNMNMKFYSIPVKYNIDDKSSIKFLSIRKNFDILFELVKVINKLKN